MIVNTGATIITQTLESVESSSDEVPWNGVSVTLIKENEIWLILDSKASTLSVKNQFWKKSHHCKENLYFFILYLAFFCSDTWRQQTPHWRGAHQVILQSGGQLQICIYWSALSYLRSATGTISSWGQTSSLTHYLLQYLFIWFFFFSL